MLLENRVNLLAFLPRVLLQVETSDDLSSDQVHRYALPCLVEQRVGRLVVPRAVLHHPHEQSGHVLVLAPRKHPRVVYVASDRVLRIQVHDACLGRNDRVQPFPLLLGLFLLPDVFHSQLELVDPLRLGPGCVDQLDFLVLAKGKLVPRDVFDYACLFVDRELRLHEGHG